MNLRNIKISILLALAINMPAEAFWGSFSSSIWQKVRSSGVSIADTVREHKTAIAITAGVAVTAAIAYKMYKKYLAQKAVTKPTKKALSPTDTHDTKSDEAKKNSLHAKEESSMDKSLLSTETHDSKSENQTKTNSSSSKKKLNNDKAVTSDGPLSPSGASSSSSKEDGYGILLPMPSEKDTPATKATESVSDQELEQEIKNFKSVDKGISIDALSKQCQQMLKKLPYSKDQKDHVLCGAFVQFALTTNNQVYINKLHKMNRKELVSGLIWYWYARAYMRDQSFEEGTFVVYDPSGTLYDFIIDQDDIYKRPSSHFKEYALYHKAQLKDKKEAPLLNKMQRGLDYDDQTLPANKGTLLIGPLTYDNTAFFVKPENYGCAMPKEYTAQETNKVLYNAAMHLWEFGVAQVRKKAQKLSESPVREFLHEYLGFDDDPDWRKERIPHDLIQAYQKLLKKAQLPDERAIELLQEALAYGIQKMTLHAYTTLKQKLKNDEGLKAFQQKLQPYDFSALRFGREVIICTDQSADRMKYNHLLKQSMVRKNSKIDVETLFNWAPKLSKHNQLNIALDQHLIPTLDVKNLAQYKKILDHMSKPYEQLISQADAQLIYAHMCNINQVQA